MELEGTKRVLVIRRYKNNERHSIGGKRLQYPKSIHLRHLHIQEEKVRMLLANRSDRFPSIDAFPYNFNL